MKRIEDTLDRLSSSGNFRSIPQEALSTVHDFSSNDYLGIAGDISLRNDFLRSLSAETFLPTSSASRMLAAPQKAYSRLEDFITGLYDRPALLFNSGYHANTGMLAALGGKNTLFVADKLVHASIIDGMVLSGSRFERFRHNDYAHLERIIERLGSGYERLVIVAESVYSMDGDRADIGALIRAKRLHPDTVLYLDEAHAVGVIGPSGLGLGISHGGDVDIIVGTLGKAYASAGAYAVMSPVMRRFMVNTCRSLIFSTALPPVTAAWSLATMRRSLEMDADRERLRNLAASLAEKLGSAEASHIQPLIIGDAALTVEISRKLLADGFKVLPIRTPTVPPGTERLRFSLSAAISPETVEALGASLSKIEFQK